VKDLSFSFRALQNTLLNGEDREVALNVYCNSVPNFRTPVSAQQCNTINYQGDRTNEPINFAITLLLSFLTIQFLQLRLSRREGQQIKSNEPLDDESIHRRAYNYLNCFRSEYLAAFPATPAATASRTTVGGDTTASSLVTCTGSSSSSVAATRLVMSRSGTRHSPRFLGPHLLTARACR
jgi:hypothetical protein